MAIGNQLVFDINGNVEDFIFILSTKDYHHLGAIQNVIPESVKHSNKLASAGEISFEVYKTVRKEIDDEIVDYEEPLWDEIVDLKSVYVRELNEYFEIEVQLDDSTDAIKKTVTAKTLCEAELSQTNIHGLEINTEIDISRPEYDKDFPTIFYNSERPDSSLLHRVLSDMSGYTIMHVDESLCKLQRTFSVDGTSIYDWLTGECAEEFNCLFQFDSTNRGIYVYDLYTVCKNDKCNHRGDFIDECPECKGTNLDYFGEDTTIYIDKENLTDSIQFTTDVGAIKNCFYLEAGDDIITSTVRLINKNGTNFLFFPTDEQLAEMPKEVSEKIVSYNEKYLAKQSEYEGIISDLFYARSQIDYYTHIMMPPTEHTKVTAKTEADKLTAQNLNPLGLRTITYATKDTVESALKNYAKVFVNTGYVKLDINQSNYTYVGKKADGWNHGTWTGNFKVTSYSDEKDVAYSQVITVDVYDNNQEFIEQRIMKNISTNSNEEGSVLDILSSDLNTFKDKLKSYCLKRLESFADAIQLGIDVLIDEKQSSDGAELYNALYLPYYEKLQACQHELDARQATIYEWQTEYDELELLRQGIQDDLNFQNHLGEDLYKIFCMYRREDTYRNDNYISDGLTDSEILQKAKDFLDVAGKELQKARTPKHSISATLHNLLIMPEFKPITDHFKLGNWLRICVDGTIYRLRLIGYELSFSSIQTLSVEFASVTKLNTVENEVKDILSQAQSMAGNFDYYAGQAKKGNEASVEVRDWLENGLNSALITLKNSNDNGNTIDKHGITLFKIDDITGNADQKQARWTYNQLCYTTDNWRSVVSSLGEHDYYKFDGKDFIKDTAYGLSCTFVTAGYVYGTQIISGDIYSENYKIDATGNCIQGSHFDLSDGTFSFGGGALKFDGNALTISSPSIPSKVSQLTNDSGYQNASQVTTITETTISTTNVIAQNLKVNSANINGQLTANQINTKGLEAESVSSTWAYLGDLSAEQIKTGILTSDDSKKSTVINLNDGTFSFGKGVLTWDNSDLKVEGDIYATRLRTTGNVDFGNSSIRAGNEKTLGSNPWIINMTPTDVEDDDPHVVYFGCNNEHNTSGGYTYDYTDTRLRGKNVTIYAHSDGQVTINNLVNDSDENIKDIVELDERYDDFFMNIKPVLYKYKYGGHRLHGGYGARQIAQALSDANISTEEFAGLVIKKDAVFFANDKPQKVDELYSLRYEEFIPLCTRAVQKALIQSNELQDIINEQSKLISKYEDRIINLESVLQKAGLI